MRLLTAQELQQVHEPARTGARRHRGAVLVADEITFDALASRSLFGPAPTTRTGAVRSTCPTTQTTGSR
ncbi:hypothetical protein GCM10018773_64110 [Streptomyces candidus]|nr:hypothetical protein GCM10018773_64110 [Streptomyces candidus]